MSAARACTTDRYGLTVTSFRAIEGPRRVNQSAAQIDDFAAMKPGEIIEAA